jgi:hypothetical protein
MIKVTPLAELFRQVEWDCINDHLGPAASVLLLGNSLVILFASVIGFYYRVVYLMVPLFSPTVTWITLGTSVMINLPPMLLIVDSTITTNKLAEELTEECTVLIAESDSKDLPPKESSQKARPGSGSSKCIGFVQDDDGVEKHDARGPTSLTRRGNITRGNAAAVSGFDEERGVDASGQVGGISHGGLGEMKLALLVERAPCEIKLLGRKPSWGDVSSPILLLISAQVLNAIGLGKYAEGG